MGIRKHFEEMKGEKEIIKFSDFSVEVERSKESRINIKEIVRDELGSLRATLDEYRDVGDWGDFIIVASDLILILPDEKDGLGLNDSDFNAFKAWFKGRMFTTEDFADHLIAVKIVFADRFDEFEMSFRSLIDSLKTEMQEALDEERYSSYSRIASKFRILFPDRISDIDQGRKTYESLAREIRSDYDEKIWNNYITEVKNLRILFEDADEDFDFDDPGLIQFINSRLEQSSAKESWLSFMLDASRFYLASAEKVRVTNNGLRVINTRKKSDLRQKKKPRPVRKQF